MRVLRYGVLIVREPSAELAMPLALLLPIPCNSSPGIFLIALWHLLEFPLPYFTQTFIAITIHLLLNKIDLI